MKKALLIISILLISSGGYFLFESIKHKNLYNSLKEKQPEQINIDFYKKGKYEFGFSNNTTTKYTTAILALSIASVKTNFPSNNDMKKLECNYEIYNEENKQVASKKINFGNVSFEKVSPNQQLIHLGSIKWLPDGKYKIIFDVSAPCSDNLFGNYKLLFMRHIALGELLGIIFWYQLFGVCCFIGGIIFYVFRSLFCRRAKCSVE
ncbi:MAG: hypothetical protein KAS17_00085 [Victivallaceae bacterium]|nr:hypothetical protein [Victivallaceae bacterium]